MIRTFQRWLGVALLCAGATSLADPNDFRIFVLGNPNTNPAANANFEAFTKELGAALTSTNLLPPATLGHAGFSLTFEASTVYLGTAPINNDTTSATFGQDVQAAPPSGKFYLPTERQPPTYNGASPLLLPSIHVRKGLPFSLELGARATWIDKSQMAAAMGEIRWAVNEGFAYLPDICVRGYGMRLFNTRDFDLGAVGLDLGVGKKFAIGGMITLTPYVGWNLVWLGAGSNTVDFNPGRTYAQSLTNKSGQPDANAQLRDDTGVFKEVSLADNSHNRVYGGVRFIGGVFQLMAEISYSALGQVSYPTGKVDLPAVIALNGAIGLDF